MLISRVLVTNWRITSRGGGGGGGGSQLLLLHGSNTSIVAPDVEWMPCQQIMCSLNEIHQWYMNITNLYCKFLAVVVILLLQPI